MEIKESIEKLHARKEQLNSDIKKLILEFKEETGLLPIAVNIDSTSLGVSRNYEIIKVRTTVIV